MMKKQWQYEEETPTFQKLPKKQHNPDRKNKSTLRAQRKQKQREQG